LRGRSPFLIIHPDTKLARRYHPLKENPSLYREFAKLPFTDEAILEFANSYGWLGVGEPVISPDLPPDNLPTLPRRVMIQGEGRNLWHDEIQAMNFLINLWDWKNSGESARLRNFLRWDSAHHSVSIEGGIANQKMLDSSDPIVTSALQVGRSVVDLPVRLFYELIADSERRDSHLFRSWKFGEADGPITLYVAHEINKRLQEHVSPRILIAKDGPGGYTVPKNLLGALWLQFYQSVIGERKIIKCSVCKRDMDVTDSRSSKRMHDACARREQMKRYHERRRKQQGG
jgi:hypothetical protein